MVSGNGKTTFTVYVLGVVSGQGKTKLTVYLCIRSGIILLIFVSIIFKPSRNGSSIVIRSWNLPSQEDEKK